MKYLKIFTDFMDVVEPLSDEERGRLFMAMLGYALDGRDPVLTGNERFLWTVAKQHINREVAAYMTKVKNLRRGNGPESEEKNPESEEDNDKYNDNNKYKNNDNDSLSIGGAGAPDKREKKPTLEEVMLYAQEAGLSTDAEYFYNYYAANGWRIGKSPMRDWKAALRVWARKETASRAPAREDKTRDTFLAVMEMARREEAKEIAEGNSLPPILLR